MAKILRTTDIIRFEVGEVKFGISPLSVEKKSLVSGATRLVGGEYVHDLVTAQQIFIKHSLKELSGVQDYDGNEYVLEFENGSLTDECVDDIFNLEQRSEFMVIGWEVFNGLADKIKDPKKKKLFSKVNLEVVGKSKA